MALQLGMGWGKGRRVVRTALKLRMAKATLRSETR
jgi:hypothetical protein